MSHTNTNLKNKLHTNEHTILPLDLKNFEKTWMIHDNDLFIPVLKAYCISTRNEKAVTFASNNIISLDFSSFKCILKTNHILMYNANAIKVILRAAFYITLTY